MLQIAKVLSTGSAYATCDEYPPIRPLILYASPHCPLAPESRPPFRKYQQFRGLLFLGLILLAFSLYRLWRRTF